MCAAANGEYQDTPGSTVCKKCWSNSFSRADRSTCDCNVLHYLTLPGVCEPCPAGADCTQPGTTVQNVVPIAGYAADVTGTNLRFLACFVPDACAAGGNCTAGMCDDTLCLFRCTAFNAALCCAVWCGVVWCVVLCCVVGAGYSGNLCTVCPIGRARAASFDCEDCPSTLYSELMTAAAVISVCLAFGVLTYLTRRAKKGTRPAVFARIVLNAMQLNALAVAFRYKWPSAIELLVQYEQKAVYVGAK